MTQSYTHTLSEFGRTTRFEDLPADTVQATRRLVLDTVGCAVAGYNLPSSEIVTRVKVAQGGVAQATVLGGGQRLPVAQTAYVNSHMANAIDGEDTLNYTAHIAACTVPPAIALAEMTGKSGADLLAAVAVGYEVAGRIGASLKGLSIDEEGNLKFAPISGYSFAAFGSVIAAGRLLDLDEAQMLNAVGIAAVTIPLPSASKFGLDLPRPMTKYAMYGTLGELGVTAALLAREGFTGELSILDGDKGFWRMFGSLECNWEALTDRLGERWLVKEAAYKPYPGCRFLNPALDMFQDLRAAHSLELDEIDHIDVTVHGAAVAKNMDKNSVVSMVDACFSAPYLIAASALAGPPGPAWHTPEARADARIRAFASKVSVTPEPSAAAAAAEDLRTRGHIARLPSTIKIMARGQVFEARSEYAKGDPYTPQTAFGDTEIEQKFHDFCGETLGGQQTTAAVEVLRQLESETTITRFVSHLVKPAN